MIEISLLIIFLILLTYGSAYFSGSETALFSLSPMRVKTYNTSEDSRKQLIAKLLNKPRDLLVTVFMMNTLVNILLQNVSSNLFGKEAGWDLKVGVPLLITLILGEIIPKNVCMQNNVAISHHVIPSINFFHQILKPIRKITIAVTDPISRAMFFYLHKEESISKEELQHVLATSEKHGVLHPDETLLVQGYLNLQGTTVKEVMCPKEDILYYETTEPLTKLIHLFIDQECSRLPVCEDGIDRVIGIITAKQYFLNRDKIKEPEDVRKYLLKPFYIPETTQAQLLLRQFDQTGRVIALAVDEYGSISGLVTREDIFEEVVGEIFDRRDHKPQFTPSGKDEIIASGKLELSEFTRLFDVELESGTGMVTLGGWLTEKLGEIPKAGTKFEWNSFIFKVLAADPNRIRRIYIRKGQL